MSGRKPKVPVPSGNDQVDQASPQDSADLVYKDTTAISFERASFFEGPLPDPESLAGYEHICPGAADRIIRMAEAQSRHRHEIERAVIASNCKVQERGPLFGFILALIVVAIGTVLTFMGKQTVGLTALIAALASIVIPFVYGKISQGKELAAKKAELEKA